MIRDSLISEIEKAVEELNKFNSYLKSNTNVIDRFQRIKIVAVSSKRVYLFNKIIVLVDLLDTHFNEIFKLSEELQAEIDTYIKETLSTSINGSNVTYSSTLDTFMTEIENKLKNSNGN